MKTILAIVMFLGMTPVYEPGSIIPKYFIDKTPQGEYRVYDSKQIVVPKYIVKPDRWVMAIECTKRVNWCCLCIELSGRMRCNRGRGEYT